jgi:excisionase family DNA binding protein
LEAPASLVLATDVAKLLRIEPRTVYVWAAQGRIPCIRFGGKAIRFDPAAIAAWIEEHSEEVTA